MNDTYILARPNVPDLVAVQEHPKHGYVADSENLPIRQTNPDVFNEGSIEQEHFLEQNQQQLHDYQSQSKPRRSHFESTLIVIPVNRSEAYCMAEFEYSNS